MMDLVKDFKGFIGGGEKNFDVCGAESALEGKECGSGHHGGE